MNSRFETLCDGCCDLAGLAALHPESDGEGAQAARFAVDDIDVELLCESESANRFVSRVFFGPLPPGDESQQWDDLLETNFLIFGPGGAAFSREPWTGHAVLQQSWPAATTPQALFGVISPQCQTAWRWRNATLTMPAFAQNTAPAGPRQQVPVMNATPVNVSAFQTLFDGFRQVANLPELSCQSLDSGLTSFFLGIEGVDVQVSHAGESFAHVVIDTDLGAHDAQDTTLAAELAEANAWLLTHEHGAVICKRPVTREYVVRTALALDQAAQGAALLSRVQSQVRAVAAIRRNFSAVAETVRTVPSNFA